MHHIRRANRQTAPLHQKEGEKFELTISIESARILMKPYAKVAQSNWKIGQGTK